MFYTLFLKQGKLLYNVFLCRFLAAQASFVSIAFSYKLGVCTVHKRVKVVCSEIIERIMKEIMPVPKKEHRLRIIEEFWITWNFPNCIGAIDGKQVVITAPANFRSQFFNYKKTFSIVLMIIMLLILNTNSCFDVGAHGKPAREVFLKIKHWTSNYMIKEEQN